MDGIVLTVCLYCDPLKDGTGYECDMAPSSCFAMDWYSVKELVNYSFNGKCRYYNKSHKATKGGCMTRTARKMLAEKRESHDT